MENRRDHLSLSNAVRGKRVKKRIKKIKKEKKIFDIDDYRWGWGVRI